VVQAYHLAKLIGQMTDPEDFVILCGDMNSEPVDPCYRIIKELPQLNDSWLERGAKVILSNTSSMTNPKYDFWYG
jgi:endonuclease/exonuclease/phosphatase family metal-dependent hydrolase